MYTTIYCGPTMGYSYRIHLPCVWYPGTRLRPSKPQRPRALQSSKQNQPRRFHKK